MSHIDKLRERYLKAKTNSFIKQIRLLALKEYEEALRKDIEELPRYATSEMISFKDVKQLLNTQKMKGGNKI